MLRDNQLMTGPEEECRHRMTEDRMKEKIGCSCRRQVLENEGPAAVMSQIHLVSFLEDKCLTNGIITSVDIQKKSRGQPSVPNIISSLSFSIRRVAQEGFISYARPNPSSSSVSKCCSQESFHRFQEGDRRSVINCWMTIDGWIPDSYLLSYSVNSHSPSLDFKKCLGAVVYLHLN